MANLGFRLINRTRTSNPIFHQRIHQFCSQPPSPQALPINAPPPTNYSGSWLTHRFFSYILLPVLPYGLAYPGKVTDVLIATCLVAHGHLGLSVIVTDYVEGGMAPGAKLLRFIRKTILGLSIGTLVGLLYLTFADIGIANTIRGIWAVKSKPRE
ncbi:succinate dehydrogenase [ubiquinone] cytochrome b small subunit, mitochondrial [Culex quinquefasciatus]|uniref:succinate dehydrogenase [ubiquinone] cytochrome b small subunit, mitochondrial n=1 Tax=Culex quinquefasciatus TaxID=7176 RepID=UPI0018E3ADE0|nr:succinate dehydrogenase [ubiquinone] cytochrome b small subunit, mitochondrial [Culex quinquefasciatus]